MTDPHAEFTAKEPTSSPLERFAEFALSWPLAAGLGILCLWEILAWGPNYLTWPLWADHDVFATAATSWEAGTPPYREFYGNNFPGTIYLFWLFGKLFGGKAGKRRIEVRRRDRPAFAFKIDAVEPRSQFSNGIIAAGADVRDDGGDIGTDTGIAFAAVGDQCGKGDGKTFAL